MNEVHYLIWITIAALAILIPARFIQLRNKKKKEKKSFDASLTPKTEAQPPREITKVIGAKKDLFGNQGYFLAFSDNIGINVVGYTFAYVDAPPDKFVLSHEHDEFHNPLFISAKGEFHKPPEVGDKIMKSNNVPLLDLGVKLMGSLEGSRTGKKKDHLYEVIVDDTRGIDALWKGIVIAVEIEDRNEYFKVVKKVDQKGNYVMKRLKPSKKFPINRIPASKFRYTRNDDFELGGRFGKISQNVFRDYSGSWPRQIKDKQLKRDWILFLEEKNVESLHASQSVLLDRSQKDIAAFLKLPRKDGSDLTDYFKGRALKKNVEIKIDNFLSQLRYEDLHE